MEIRPLRCDIDTMEFTYAGEVPEDVIERLTSLKEYAQGRDEPQPVQFEGVDLFVRPRGQGLWPYVATNSQIQFAIGTAANIPPMKVKLLQRGLAERGARALVEEADGIARSMGLSRLNCTRVDVACDFQGWVPTLDEMRHVVCPAPFRPVYPSLDKPETFQFGKGTAVVRVYDKRKEIAANRKQWWEFIWRTCRDYDSDEPVWRVEVQLRAEALKQLECRSVGAVLDNMHGLFEFGLDWCSVRTPSGDSNPSRWEVHPAWAYLKRSYMPGQPLGRVRPAVTLVDYDRAVRNYLALVSSVGATLGSDDYWHICKVLSVDAQEHMERKLEVEFEDLVERKRRRRHL